MEIEVSSRREVTAADFGKAKAAMYGVLNRDIKKGTITTETIGHINLQFERAAIATLDQSGSEETVDDFDNAATIEPTSLTAEDLQTAIILFEQLPQTPELQIGNRERRKVKKSLYAELERVNKKDADVEVSQLRKRAVVAETSAKIFAGATAGAGGILLGGAIYQSIRTGTPIYEGTTIPETVATLASLYVLNNFRRKKQ